MRPLWVYAARSEGQGVVDRLGDALEIGTGKVAAAANLSMALVQQRPPAVIAFGVCGAYPREHGALPPTLDVGELCVVTRDVLADEGVRDESGFRGLEALGLGTQGPFVADPSLSAVVASRLGGLPLVEGATVSTCSGTDARSRELATRTGAQVETMEGAAIGHVCAHFGIPWTQLRCVSNRTGDRSAAGWDLEGALATLHRAVVALLECGFE